MALRVTATGVPSGVVTAWSFATGALLPGVTGVGVGVGVGVGIGVGIGVGVAVAVARAPWLIQSAMDCISAAVKAPPGGIPPPLTLLYSVLPAASPGVTLPPVMAPV